MVRERWLKLAAPEVIEARLRLGDFEGDMVLGPPGTGGLATLVDRKGRYTIVVKTEFARCHRLEQHLGMQLYFPEPGCPQQRGTNENTNGLIRQFFSQGDRLSRRHPCSGARGGK